MSDQKAELVRVVDNNSKKIVTAEAGRSTWQRSKRWMSSRTLMRNFARFCRPEQRLNHAVLIICMTVIGLLWIAYATYIAKREQLTLKEAGQETANLALAFEQQAERTIRAVDQVMLFVKTDYERDPDRFNLKSWAAERIYVDTLYHQIVIADAEGLMTMLTSEMPKNPVYLNDREHFRVHADGLVDGLFISQPVLGRASGKWSIQLSRRVDLEGGFGGMIVISLDPGYLSTLFAEANLGDTGKIVLVGHDGVIRAGSPANLSRLNQVIPDSPLKRVLGLAKHGTHVDDTGADDRIESFRQIGQRPLTIAVSVATSQLLSSVNKEAMGLKLVLIPLSLVLLAMSIGLMLVIERRRRQQMLLLRRTRQLSKANAAIEMANQRLEHRVAVRTAELEANRRDLETTIDRLSATSAELAEQGKMASLGRVVAGIAHEVNTPLGVAITCASAYGSRLDEFKRLVDEASLRRSDLSDFIAMADEASSIVLVNLDRAAGLIRSFKQVAANQHVGDERDIDLGSYLGDIMTSLLPEIRRNGHRLDLDLKTPILIKLRVDALWQIISGLTVNAVTHAFAPGEKGTLALSIAQEQGVAVIRFRDNGMGMSSEVLRQIFEPFFTTKRGKGGTGLGLSIIYTLVTDSLNGRVYCESELGCGSEFVITLPMIDQLVACDQ